MAIVLTGKRRSFGRYPSWLQAQPERQDLVCCRSNAKLKCSICGWTRGSETAVPKQQIQRSTRCKRLQRRCRPSVAYSFGDTGPNHSNSSVFSCSAASLGIQWPASTTSYRHLPSGTYLRARQGRRDLQQHECFSFAYLLDLLVPRIRINITVA